MYGKKTKNNSKKRDVSRTRETSLCPIFDKIIYFTKKLDRISFSIYFIGEKGKTKSNKKFNLVKKG